MLCHEMTIQGEVCQCPNLNADLCCPRRPLEYMFFVTRRGYCADIDVYGDPKKQAEYEKSKRDKKVVAKQQKQGRHK